MNEPNEVLARSLGATGAALIGPHMEAVTFGDGAVLLREGLASEHLFLVVSGGVGVVHEAEGGSVDLGARGVGAWLGEVGVIDGGPATATVRAVGSCEALQISRLELSHLAESHPEAAAVLLREISRQLAERIARSSSGIVEQLGHGQVRVRKPDEVRGWTARVLGWLLGGEKQ